MMRYLAWATLVVLAQIWGFVTGLCLAGSPVMSWLDPGVAVFGMLGVWVIVFSLLMAARERSVSDTRSSEG